MKTKAIAFLVFVWLQIPLCGLIAQPLTYSSSNGHAHNDYATNIPFTQAHRLGFGSIEADVFLVNDTLFVAHSIEEINRQLMLNKAYLQPLAESIANNNGYAYQDTSKKLMLLIDLKTEAVNTLNAVITSIQKYPGLTTCKSLQLVITGNQPPAETFKSYPSYIYFDGNLLNNEHVKNLDKIALFSADFTEFSKWNGKGVLPEAELKKLKASINAVHQLNKPIRFWASPDNINTWFHFKNLGIDYINTDKIEAFANFATTLKKSSSISADTYDLYEPQYKVDGDNTRVKNVILIIGDGTGLAQWHAGYTGNKGKLNLYNMRSIGLSKTSAADSYITDSGAGATAMATGQKTNNRFIAVNPQLQPVPSLPELIATLGMQTGIITTGDVTDATPAAFYSHTKERSESENIAAQLMQSKATVLIGSGIAYFNQRKDGKQLIRQLQNNQFSVIQNYRQLDTVTQNRILVLDKTADVHANEGRGNFLSASLNFTIKKLQKNQTGFFIMAEGAQVDHAGHDNDLSWLVEEVKDLDKAIGDAMKFADENKETLVIVTADHETGGLSLLSGNVERGYVAGNFSSDDHSGICVPVFAYGPQSRVFCGVYENTAIFTKIMAIINTTYKP